MVLPVEFNPYQDVSQLYRKEKVEKKNQCYSNRGDESKEKMQKIMEDRFLDNNSTAS